MRVTLWCEDAPHLDFVLWFDKATRVLVGLSVEPAVDVEGVSEGRAAPRERPAVVTRRLIRGLPIGQMEAMGRRAMASVAANMRRHPSRTAELVDVAALLETMKAQPRPGRRGRSDAEYAAVAARYVAHLGSGTEAEDVAAELNYSASQVRSLLYEARRRELLTAAPSGRAGGELTEKARRLLSGEH